MRKKVVSPGSIQKIVVLDPQHGPLTIHKRRAKSKSPKTLKQLVKSDSFKRAVRGVRTAHALAGAARALTAISRPTRW